MARIEVLYKGQSIVSASLNDLYAMAFYLLGRAPMQYRKSDAAAGARIGVTVPILFGRTPLDPVEAFPAVRRGELQLQSTPAASFVALDNVTLQIETVELLDATPERFLKYTTISKTPTAVGDHDVDLPIGNLIAALLLFGTSVPTDAADTTSINQLRLLVDNVEHAYALANWESLKGHEALWCDQDWQGAEITSRLAAGAPAGDAATESAEWGTAFLRQYACLPFAIGRMPEYMLDTAGRARVHLRINADVADAIRVMPVELIPVQGAART
jgi:hypothetical protein